MRFLRLDSVQALQFPEMVIPLEAADSPHITVQFINVLLWKTRGKAELDKLRIPVPLAATVVWIARRYHGGDFGARKVF